MNTQNLTFLQKYRVAIIYFAFVAFAFWYFRAIEAVLISSVVMIFLKFHFLSRLVHRMIVSYHRRKLRKIEKEMSMHLTMSVYHKNPIAKKKYDDLVRQRYYLSSTIDLISAEV